MSLSFKKGTAYRFFRGKSPLFLEKSGSKNTCFWPAAETPLVSLRGRICCENTKYFPAKRRGNPKVTSCRNLARSLPRCQAGTCAASPQLAFLAMAQGKPTFFPFHAYRRQAFDTPPQLSTHNSQLITVSRQSRETLLFPGTDTSTRSDGGLLEYES